MGVFEQSIITFLAPIAPFLADESISEVLINGPGEIWIEQKGHLTLTEIKFQDETALQAAVRNIAQFVKRRIDSENPTLDARLPDGSRIHAVLPPSARKGTTVAIRKFSKAKDLSFEKLVTFGSVSAEGSEFLTQCIALGKNIVVSGGTGSGKTTILNLLGGLLPAHERLMVVEDASELQIKAPHVVCFETKAANHEGKGGLMIRDLIRSAMRLRPDRIIVGEVRGGEALDLITVMNTGHDGSMGTVHANSPMDALVRLETLASLGDTTIPIAALRRQISGAVHLIVQAKRFRDGSRKLSHISEVLGCDDHGNYKTQDIFKFIQTAKLPDGTIQGCMQPMGNLPTFYDEFEVNGLIYDRAKFYKPGKMPARTVVPVAGSAVAAAPAPALQASATPAAQAPQAAPQAKAITSIEQLSAQQLQAMQTAASKSGMSVQQYFQWWLQQRQKQAGKTGSAA